MQKTFFAIVTQFDCSTEQAAQYSMEQHGPVLFECYLNEHAIDEEKVRAHAQNFKKYGWVRVARVTVDIPEESPCQPAPKP